MEEFMKMPDPMMPPITDIVPEKRPRVRRYWTGGWGTVAKLRGEGGWGESAVWDDDSSGNDAIQRRIILDCAISENYHHS
jgi:hypothetical protein